MTRGHVSWVIVLGHLSWVTYFRITCSVLGIGSLEGGKPMGSLVVVRVESIGIIGRDHWAGSLVTLRVENPRDHWAGSLGGITGNFEGG